MRPHEALDFKLPIDRYIKGPPITLQPAIQIGLLMNPVRPGTNIALPTSRAPEHVASRR